MSQPRQASAGAAPTSKPSRDLGAGKESGAGAGKRGYTTGKQSEQEDTTQEELSESESEEVVCERCHAGDDETKFLLCEDCPKGFHIYCLRPKLARVPKARMGGRDLRTALGHFSPPSNSRFASWTFHHEPKLQNPGTTFYHRPSSSPLTRQILNPLVGFIAPRLAVPDTLLWCPTVDGPKPPLGERAASPL